MDNSGNAYVAGRTTSTDFPTSHAAQASYGGGESDAFVSELNAAGTALVYSTYLGGSGSESPMWHYHDLVSVALSTDKSGHTFAYVAGGTGSTNFPTTPGAYQRGFGGGGGDPDGELSDAFVAKYDPAGAVVYASYFGGSMNDIAAGIAADSAGNAYLTGYTNSEEFANDPGGLSGCCDGLRRLCDEDQSRRLWARLLDLPGGTGWDWQSPWIRRATPTSRALRGRPTSRRHPGRINWLGEGEARKSSSRS